MARLETCDFVCRALAAVVFNGLFSWFAFAEEPAQELLTAAHSHNDYHRDRPLLDALNLGFGQVEADIHLDGGILLVGHERSELRADRTLRSLYLDPLRRRIQDGDGSVYGDGTPLTLLIDVKTDAETTYVALHQVLSQYSDIVSEVRDGKLTPRAVTIVLSGNRAWDLITAAQHRYVGIDGRLGDLGSDAPSHLVPWISDNWTSHFTWRGTGAMPADQRTRLDDAVAQAHAHGRRIRFWATPENPAVWATLVEAGVDIIGTDDLPRLAAYLRSPGILPGK